MYALIYSPQSADLDLVRTHFDSSIVKPQPKYPDYELAMEAAQGKVDELTPDKQNTSVMVMEILSSQECVCVEQIVVPDWE